MITFYCNLGRPVAYTMCENFLDFVGTAKWPSLSGTFLGWETGTYCGPHFSESIILTNFLLFPLGNTLGARGDSCGRAIDFLVFLLFCSGRYASGKGHNCFDSAEPMTTLLIHVPAKFYRSG